MLLCDKVARTLLSIKQAKALRREEIVTAEDLEARVPQGDSYRKSRLMVPEIYKYDNLRIRCRKHSQMLSPLALN